MNKKMNKKIGLAHTFHCVSPKYSKFWWNMDFLSVILESALCSIIWIHLVFYCDSNMQVMFIFSCVALTISTMVTSITTNMPALRETSMGLFIFLHNF